MGKNKFKVGDEVFSVLWKNKKTLVHNTSFSLCVIVDNHEYIFDEEGYMWLRGVRKSVVPLISFNEINLIGNSSIFYKEAMQIIDNRVYDFACIMLREGRERVEKYLERLKEKSLFVICDSKEDHYVTSSKIDISSGVITPCCSADKNQAIKFTHSSAVKFIETLVSLNENMKNKYQIKLSESNLVEWE